MSRSSRSSRWRSNAHKARVDEPPWPLPARVTSLFGAWISAKESFFREVTVTAETPDESLTPRQIAGRLNRLKRKGLSAEGRERLRQAALHNKPWRFSTGPRTPAGKARAAANCKARQKGPKSVREVRAELADLRSLLRQMQETRSAVDGSNHDGL
jgi:hypothetical protein